MIDTKVERGYCECGCGAKTAIVPRSCASRGLVRGEPFRFLVGHSRRRHGLSGTPLYFTWAGMHDRCGNTNSASYARYGGRGIAVDPSWDSFDQFAADMGPKPSGKSLDRKDNDGPYAKANCRWATASEQNRNRRLTKIVNVFGTDMPLIEACIGAKMNFYTVRCRLLLGMDIHNALFMPKHTRYTGKKS